MNKYLLSISIIFSLLLSNQIFAQTYLISSGGTINTCSGTLYDSGGAGGDYSNGENHTITICSETGGSIELFFSQFQFESVTWDNLTIYDGPNTSSPLLVPASGGTTLQGQTVESTGSCLTLVMITDGSVTYPGFAAEISCGYPCQDYSIDIVNTVPGLSDPDSVWIDVCLGESITFTAQGTYPNNNQEYTQSDATTDWYWSLSSGGAPDEYNGVGMNNFTHTFDESGGYFLSLYSRDVNGCIATYSGELRIRVSIPPTFSNITQDQTQVCPGEEVNFTGDVSTNSWVMSITDTQVVEECVDDYQGVVQEFCWTVNSFEPGQTIQSGSDFEGVCMGLEHTFLGDLEMYVRCPNNTQVLLHEFLGIGAAGGCGGTDLGVPVSGANCVPGVCWDYCWNDNGTQTFQSICGSVSTIPAGDYLPAESFDNFIGCPINGEWCVVIIDDWGGDDGTLCTVDLAFSSNIIPADVWSFDHTYDSDDIVWSGNGIEPNSGGNATAYPDTPGDQVYTFSVTDNFGCTYDTTLTVNVLDFDDPTCCTQPFPEVGNDTSLCQNYFTFNPVTTTGNTVNWTMISGPGNAVWQNQNSPNATVTVDAWGIYVFELYEENLSPACSATEQIEVQFWPVPTAEFNYTPAMCFGDVVVVNYIGNASPTATYSWDFDYGNINSGSGAGPYQIVWDTAGIHEVTLQVTENGCASNDTIVEILNPEELVYDLTVIDDPCYQSCNGRAILEVSGGTIPYDYSWGSPTNILSNLCVGDYVVSVTDANDCEVSANFSINQPPELIITDTSYTHVSCFEADDATMSISVEGGTGDYIYQWTEYGNAGPIISDVSAGNYWVTVTDENACEVVEFFQIYQPDELQVVISNSISICEGQTLNVTAQQQGGTPPYIYYWDDGNGIFTAASTLTVTPDTTTTYSVYVEDVRGCVSNTASMTITVSPTLVIEELLLEDNLCYHSCDGRAELVLTGGIPPLSYSWSSPTNVLSDICAGLYQVTVTDAIGCQVNTHFTINEPDTLSYIITTEDATCYNYNDGEAVINVAGGTLPYNYLWPNGETSNTMTNGAGNYQVTVTDDNDCRIVANAQIGQPSQMLIQSLGNRQICIGQTTTIGAQVTGGSPYYDFYWQGSDGTSYNSHLFQVSPVETTTYNVTVTDSHACTAVKQNITVNVYPELEISAIVTSYDTICEGEPAIIIVDVVGGNGGPYQLELENGQIVASPFSIYLDETSYVHVTASDNCGTPSVSDSIKITVMPTPPNVFTADRLESCAPGLISFSELSPNQGQLYLWNFGDNGFANIKNPNHLYRTEGTYDVSLTVKSDYGCENTRIIQEMITIHPKPVASFYMEPENTTILKPEVQFTNLSVDAFYQFWFFGDGDSSLYFNPRHTYAGMGEYEIKLIVESEHGCMDTTYRTLFIEGINTFYAPETFTPNGDGVNDCFRVCGTGIDPNYFKIVIYDRWGNRVYYSEEYKMDAKCDACSSGAWDGTNNGDRNKGDAYLPTGNYTWHCEYKDWNGITYEKTGLVRIVR